MQNNQNTYLNPVHYPAMNYNLNQNYYPNQTLPNFYQHQSQQNNLSPFQEKNLNNINNNFNQTQQYFNNPNKIDHTVKNDTIEYDQNLNKPKTVTFSEQVVYQKDKENFPGKTDFNENVNPEENQEHESILNKKYFKKNSHCHKKNGVKYSK